MLRRGRLWHAVQVSSSSRTRPADQHVSPQPTDAPVQGAPEVEPVDPRAIQERAEVQALVGEWLAIPDLVEVLDVSLREVRRMLQDRELVGLKVGHPVVLRVPAKFIADGRPLVALRGTFTVLNDSGLDDLAATRWLFTTDPTLPVEGAPVDALLAGHKTEIRRRAQELAF